MKIKKIIFLLVLIMAIISLNYKSYAKYVFEYIEIAAKISIKS